MVNSKFERTRPDCKIEKFYTKNRHKKIDRFSGDVFYSHCNAVSEAVGCFYHSCLCQELRPSLTEEDIKRRSKKRDVDESRQGYLQQKSFTVNQMWECEWWKLYKPTTNVKLHIGEHFPYRRLFAAEKLLEEIKEGKLIGYVQCDVRVPENLIANFANFPLLFNNTLVRKNDNGSLMKTYAEDEK